VTSNFEIRFAGHEINLLKFGEVKVHKICFGMNGAHGVSE